MGTVLTLMFKLWSMVSDMLRFFLYIMYMHIIVILAKISLGNSL